MPTGIADLQAGIASLWSDSGLDDTFRSMWMDADIPADLEGDASSYPTLHDIEALPATPVFPYCVLECAVGTDKIRMTGDAPNKKKVQDIQVTFNVHTKDRGVGLPSAKMDCANLLEQVMMVFGGHPTEKPQQIELSYGGVLLVQYLNDHIVRTELYHYQGILKYQMRLDVPFAI